GAELGRFNMGSTVIVLAEPGRIIWDAGLTNGDPVRVGQRIALRNPG
ncbi:MAG: phosphatidylserine decarboxylase, partial [Gammaproteobacteria bacterium]|nr:phosphatidylserine decarboxylase [Gammaproteobacteria bacterium]